MTNLRRQFKRKLFGKENKLQPLPGVAGDGLGNLTDSNGRFYVRIGGQVQVVSATNITPRYEQPVWVGYEPVQPGVFKILNERVTGGIAANSNGPARHANTHEWMGAGAGGGSDVVKIQSQQIMPLRVMPYSGFQVVIWPGLVRAGGNIVLIGDLNSYGKPVPLVVDLDSYAYGVHSGKAKFLLITLDTSGTVVVTEGSEVDIADLALTDIPGEPAGTLYVLAAVRIWFGQTEIAENRETVDIVDLRWPMVHNHAANEVLDIAWDDIDLTGSDLADLATKSHTSLTDKGTNTHAQIDTHIAGHTHTESQITDLSHDATNIDGIEVDLAGIADTNALVYNAGTNKIVPGEAVGGGGGGVAGDGLWYIDGALSVLAGVGLAYVVPRACTIAFVFIQCKNTGSANSTIIDIHKNGTTIFTTQGNRPTLAYNDADAVAKSGVPEIVDLVEGDVLTCDIDAVATGAEGLSVVIAMTVNPLPISGWTELLETWTYVSVDDPTGVFDITGDVRSKYSAGMRIKFTNGGNVIYGIITDVNQTLQTGNTRISFLHEIDPTDSLALYLMANSAITLPYYSVVKAPYGFPIDTRKWTVRVVDVTLRTQDNPSINTWYNVGSLQITIPIGLWRIVYQLSVSNVRASAGDICARCSLSTSNNSVSDGEFNSLVEAQGTGIVFSLSREKHVLISAKQTWYAILNTWVSSTTYLRFRGDESPCVLEAICDYL